MFIESNETKEQSLRRELRDIDNLLQGYFGNIDCGELRRRKDEIEKMFEPKKYYIPSLDANVTITPNLIFNNVKPTIEEWFEREVIKYKVIEEKNKKAPISF